MNGPKEWRDLPWRWLALFLFALAALLALLEIFSPFFYVLLKPVNKNVPTAAWDWKQSWDLLLSITLRLNLIAYLLVAGLVGLSILPVGFLSRKNAARAGRMKELAAGAGISLFLIFGVAIFSNQILSNLMPWFKMFSLALIALLSYLIGRGVFLAIQWGFKRKYGFEFAFFLGVAIFINLNLFRFSLINPTGIPILSVAIVIGLVLIISGLGLALGILPSRWRRKRAWVFPLEKCLGLGLLAFSLWLVSLPVWEWSRIFLSGWEQGIAAEKGSLPGAVKSPEATSKSPNIIMMVWDTVRADHLSLYGYSRPTTPFLDKLAPNSVVFDRAYAAAPWTTPSHASFFTGLYPSEHNCNFINLRLSDDFTTLAEKLQEKGYVTLAYSNNPLLSRSSNICQGFERLVDPQVGISSGELVHGFATRIFRPELLQDSGAQKTNQVIFSWVKRLSRQKAPFFIFINYMEAHLPYPSAKDALRFIAESDPSSPNSPTIVMDWEYYNCNKVNNEKELLNVNKRYDGAIYYLDLKLSQLYSRLEQANLLDNTILIVLSDHGEALGDHQFFGHSFFLYQSHLWVPLLIYGPPHLAPAHITQPVSLTSLPDIVFALLNHRSLEDALKEKGGGEVIFAEASPPWIKIIYLQGRCPTGFDTQRINRNLKAAIQWPYKLIWDSREADELYDLAEDPLEQKNLISQQLQIKLELSHRINLFRLTHVSPQAEGPPPLDFQTRRALQALGYAQ